jgi:uncharacterized protein GlcG (DUF336 family)
MNHIVLIRLSVLFALAGALVGCNRDGTERSTPANAQNVGSTTIAGAASGVEIAGQRAGGGCGQLPDAKTLQRMVAEAPNKGEAGGLAHGRAEWAALVDRDGRLCAVAVATADAAAAWPGSKAIAKAKAFTANAFSTDTAPMSTARLYTMSLPGHSLWGAAGGNPLNPACLTAPAQADGTGIVCGGTIAFGGGLPLYKGQTRVGGLGVSGDTPCADQEIAKRIRDAAGLDPPQGGLVDDIVYATVDGPSIFAHPLCPNTWRNGSKIGDEAPGD